MIHSIKVGIVSLGLFFSGIFGHHAQPVVRAPTVIGEATSGTPSIVTKTITVNDPAQQKQINDLTAQVANLTAQNTGLEQTIALLQATNSSQAALITTLSIKTTVPVPKTKDQLMAQYAVANPPPTKCGYNPSIDMSASAAMARCNNQAAAYNQAQIKWVNEQLAVQ